MKYLRQYGRLTSPSYLNAAPNLFYGQIFWVFVTCKQRELRHKGTLISLDNSPKQSRRALKGNRDHVPRKDKRPNEFNLTISPAKDPS